MTDRHSTTCALLVRHAACDCGQAARAAQAKSATAANPVDAASDSLSRR